MEKEEGSIPTRKRCLDEFCGSPRVVSEIDPFQLVTPEKKLLQYNRKSKKKKEQTLPSMEKASFLGDEEKKTEQTLPLIEKASFSGREEVSAVDLVSEGVNLNDSESLDVLDLLRKDANLSDLFNNPSFIARMNATLGTSLSIDTISSYDISQNETKVVDSNVSYALSASMSSSVEPVDCVYNIAQITPSTPTPWKVGIRVIEKGFPRVGRSSVNPVPYLRYILMDDQGNRVQATVFGEDIAAVRDKMNLFGRYFISNATVQPILTEHRIVPNEYQWHLKLTCVEEISTGSSESTISNPYNLVSFENFGDYLNLASTIDVLAAVVDVRRSKPVRTPTGLCTVQEVLLVDQMLNPVTLTLWDHFVDNEGFALATMSDERTIIVATRVKVTSYNGLSLSTKSSSSILIDPYFEEATALRSWCFINEAAIRQLADSVTQLPYGIKEVDHAPANVVSIKDVQSIDSPFSWVRAKASVTNLRQKFWYMSCNKCSRAAKVEYLNTFFCTNCDANQHAEPRCRIEVQLDDASGSLKATLFGEKARDVLHCDAIAVMQEMLENGNSNIASFMNLGPSEELFFQLRPNNYLWDNEPQKKYNVNDVRRLVLSSQRSNVSQSQFKVRMQPGYLDKGKGKL